jgi:hypothetical protein
MKNIEKIEIEMIQARLNTLQAMLNDAKKTGSIDASGVIAKLQSIKELVKK